MINIEKPFERLIPSPQAREIAAQTVVNLSDGLSEAKAVALVIEDNHNKARILKYELPESTVQVLSPSATGGIALFEALVTHEMPGDLVIPPVIVFMDGSLPERTGMQYVSESGMGLRTAREIIRFCQENDVVTPNFVGFSTDYEPNDGLRELLEANELADRYLGDYFSFHTGVYKRLGALGLAGYNTEV